MIGENLVVTDTVRSNGTLTLRDSTIGGTLSIGTDSILTQVVVAGRVAVHAGRHRWDTVDCADVVNLVDATVHQTRCHFRQNWALFGGTIYLDHGSRYDANAAASQLVGRNTLERIVARGALSYAGTDHAIIDMVDVQAVAGIAVSDFSQMRGEQWQAGNGGPLLTGIEQAIIARAGDVGATAIGQLLVSESGTVTCTNVKQLIVSGCGAVDAGTGFVLASDCDSVAGTGFGVVRGSNFAALRNALVVDGNDMTIKTLGDLTLDADGAVTVRGSRIDLN